MILRMWRDEPKLLSFLPHMYVHVLYKWNESIWIRSFGRSQQWTTSRTHILYTSEWMMLVAVLSFANYHRWVTGLKVKQFVYLCYGISSFSWRCPIIYDVCICNCCHWSDMNQLDKRTFATSLPHIIIAENDFKFHLFTSFNGWQHRNLFVFNLMVLLSFYLLSLSFSTRYAINFISNI